MRARLSLHPALIAYIVELVRIYAVLPVEHRAAIRQYAACLAAEAWPPSVRVRVLGEEGEVERLLGDRGQELLRQVFAAWERQDRAPAELSSLFEEWVRQSG